MWGTHSLSLVHIKVQCMRTVHVHITYNVLCPHILGTFSQSIHVMEWSCSWHVCWMHISNEKKETPKICGTFVDAALVQQWCWARKQPSSWATYRGWFRVQDFVRKIKNDFQILLKWNWPQDPKERYKILQRNSRFNQNSHIMLRYLASGNSHVWCTL